MALARKTLGTGLKLHLNQQLKLQCRRFLWNDVRLGFVGMVGKTPLIRLEKLSNETGCNIMVKAEMANGGGSVKDRAARFLIKQAVEQGKLTPGGTVVEGTAGNTGIGLAHICNAMGLKCVIFMPDTQSQEKVDMLKILGATVHQVPAVPFDNPDNYNHQARRFAESQENAVWTNQFDNTANRQAHIETTGPEIWQQTEGKVDAVTFGTGTGGTMAGVATFLKEKNPNIKTILADPQGSVLYNYIKHGKLERSEGSSITEGIGQGRVTENLKGAPIDDALCILDSDAVNMTFRLLHEDGFFVGASSGLNVTAAKQVASIKIKKTACMVRIVPCKPSIATCAELDALISLWDHSYVEAVTVQVAEMLGPGHTIVTCLCDTGQRYYARLFNKQWLQTKGLLDSVPEQYHQFLK